MSLESGLIAALGALTVLLAVLLISRIRQDRMRLAALQRMSLDDFQSLLTANLLRGDIAEVAGKVSELLKERFGCEIVVFLRKKRGTMVCNYAHGIERSIRGRLRFPFSNKLSEHLQQSCLPRSLRTINALLPEPFASVLAGTGADLYFPIYWRENLYGLYFVRSCLETDAPAFNMLLTAVAQSLAAAYHIKWHESKRDHLERRLEAPATKESKVAGSAGLADLIRLRRSDVLVPKLVQAIRKDLGMTSAALIYRDNADDRMLVVKDGYDAPLSPPAADAWQSLVKKLEDSKPEALDHVTKVEPRLIDWTESLRRSGLEYVAGFSLSEKRTGVLAFASPVQPPALAGRLRIWHQQASDLVENAESFEAMEALSFTDNLTGLANRRYLLKRMSEEVARADRHHRGLAVVLFDLDQLKSINDRHGHQAGDAVLRQLGRILGQTIRSIDIVARYGGDEFCVAMPEADRRTAEQFMVRLQKSIAKRPIELGNSSKPLHCTVSLGAALFPDHGRDPESLIHSADMALLEAKQAGRNQARVAVCESRSTA